MQHPTDWEAEARVKGPYDSGQESLEYLTRPGAERPIIKVPDISATLAERGGRYGKFIEHSEISQGLQDVMRNAPNWNKLDVDMRQALTTIVDKIARILNGDPYYDDSWHDIQGYAKLVEDRLLKMKEGQ